MYYTQKNEIVPESETRYSLNKTPPLQFHSSAKVNYTDEDEENMSEFLPVDNMKANHPDDDDDDFKQVVVNFFVFGVYLK